MSGQFPKFPRQCLNCGVDYLYFDDGNQLEARCDCKRDASTRVAYGFTDNELQSVIPQLDATIEQLWRSKVKRVPELPECYTDVLLWHSGRWNEAWYDGSWTIHEMPYHLEDGQYWLPIPTFNPEEQS